MMEGSDFIGQLVGFSNPALYASMLGVSLEDERVRLVILAILSIGVTFFSFATVWGFLRRKSWGRLAATLTAFLFIFYGLFQLMTAFTQLTRKQIGSVFAGFIFILLGLICEWMGRKTNAELVT
jgi:hypothetical protein